MFACVVNNYDLLLVEFGVKVISVILIFLFQLLIFSFIIFDLSFG